MRRSLKVSLTDSPAENFERYPKGSIVLCTACAKPIYRLDVGIALGDKAGQWAKAFKPLTVADLNGLADREDIDAGLRAIVRSWTPVERAAHVGKLPEPKAGDPMQCPICLRGFPQVVSVEKHAVLDKAYVIELLTIPPQGQKGTAIRGRQIGATKGWLHDGAAVEN